MAAKKIRRTHVERRIAKNTVPELRKKLGLKRDEFSVLLGVERVTVDEWLRTSQLPSGASAQVVSILASILERDGVPENFKGRIQRYMRAGRMRRWTLPAVLAEYVEAAIHLERENEEIKEENRRMRRALDAVGRTVSEALNPEPRTDDATISK